MKIKKIIQTHETGCVPAAIAMISGLSYDEVIRIMYPKRKGKSKSTSTWNLLKTLDKLHISFKLTHKNFTKIKNPCILLVAWQAISKTEFAESSCGSIVPAEGSHAVVWTGKKILDPYSNRPNYNAVTKYTAQQRVFLTIEIL